MLALLFFFFVTLPVCEAYFLWRILEAGGWLVLFTILFIPPIVGFLLLKSLRWKSLFLKIQNQIQNKVEFDVLIVKQIQLLIVAVLLVFPGLLSDLGALILFVIPVHKLIQPKWKNLYSGILNRIYQSLFESGRSAS